MTHSDMPGASFEQWEERFRPKRSASPPWLRSRVDVVESPAQTDFVRVDAPGRHQVLVFPPQSPIVSSSVGVGGSPVLFEDVVVPTGSTIVVSSALNTEGRLSRWSSPVRFVALSLDDAAFAQVCEAGGLDVAGVEFLNLLPQTGGSAPSDPFLVHAAFALRDEMLTDSGAAHQAHPAGRVYAESIVLATAAHVLRHYTVQRLSPQDYTGGLTRRQCRVATDYARAHLSDDVSLFDIAAAAGLSPYHFAREFKRTTGETAHEMLRRLRMDRAAALLRATTLSVLQVAFEVGYQSPSRFAAAFRRRHGVAPSVYRRG